MYFHSRKTNSRSNTSVSLPHSFPTVNVSLSVPCQGHSSVGSHMVHAATSPIASTSACLSPVRDTAVWGHTWSMQQHPLLHQRQPVLSVNCQGHSSVGSYMVHAATSPIASTSACPVCQLSGTQQCGVTHGPYSNIPYCINVSLFVNCQGHSSVGPHMVHTATSPIASTSACPVCQLSGTQQCGATHGPYSNIPYCRKSRQAGRPETDSLHKGRRQTVHFNDQAETSGI